MLPFTKRPARPEEEAIHTGDFEVIASPAAAKPGSFPPPGGRPRVFARSTSDDEMTTLMPRKGLTFSVRPPPATAPNPMPKLTSSRPPKPMLEEPPTRQFVKPSSSPPPPTVSPVAGPPRASNRPPPQALSPQLGRSALKPQPVPVLAENLKSDPKLDPPATVITARTRIIAARPTMSWAAALVAMGVFVGLVTAVVARGDSDTLIDAAASFVDPSTGRVAGSGAPSTSARTKAEAPASTYASDVDTLAAAAPEAPKVALADLPTASPVPPRPAPVAYAAPRRWWHPTPKAAPKAERAEKAEKPAEERVAVAAPKKDPPAKKARAAEEDDVTGASAADALAKAQLEASLQ